MCCEKIRVWHDKCPCGWSDVDRVRRAGRRQAGRARGYARGRHMLHPGVVARLHHPDHRGRAEHGGKGRFLAAKR